MVWKAGDSGFDAIRAGFLAGATIELAILDQDKAATGSPGPKGSFSITSFSRNEAMGDAVTASVTAKLAVFDEWVEV